MVLVFLVRDILEVVHILTQQVIVLLEVVVELVKQVRMLIHHLYLLQEQQELVVMDYQSPGCLHHTEQLDHQQEDGLLVVAEVEPGVTLLDLVVQVVVELEVLQVLLMEYQELLTLVVEVVVLVIHLGVMVAMVDLVSLLLDTQSK